MKACWVLLGIGLAAAGIGQQNIGAETDAAVINAAMGAFFGKEPPPELRMWRGGDFIAIRPWYGGSLRAGFDKRLDYLIEWAKNYKQNMKEFAMLRRAKRSIKDLGYSAGPLAPLKTLALQPWIILRENRPSEWIETVGAKNREGKPGILRAGGIIGPPCYSSDGRYAILSMSGLPNGIHSSDISFLLKRGARGWATIFVLEYSPL